MPHDLAIRKTNRYVGEYAHLDAWKSIGSYTIQASTSVSENDSLPEGSDPDMCDSHVTTMLVEVAAPEAAEADIKTALEHSNTKAGCAHEYDCCGCRSYHATAEHIGGAIWRVIVNSARNF